MSMQDRLDELIVALRQHAQVMSAPDQAGEAGIEAFEALRRAAAAYGECVREQTHWDSPFAELEEDSWEDSSEELDATSEAEQDRDLLVVSGTWTFEVTDRDAWSRFAADQLESATPALRQLSGDPAEAASALLSHDGLSAWLGAHGVALLADDWTVRDTEEELPEDDPEE
ncbi:hypothetical protein [Streptomyces fulvorobeus]|uniref:Uncharacterized protein n=1 Tax=Streptomyces fulvorobeus TaxID=284028 RepID=A0A7J0C396_9ACTN|nr:hypothetical protein [Streptomyces fulvorobeus]NYE40660.1 hypothetical protein [Streptomyces fulvorobeus]GFM96962.1 hypothetical protein Sfulv_17730 [Streptomyces fulvorobeus]